MQLHSTHYVHTGSHTSPTALADRAMTNKCTQINTNATGLNPTIPCMHAHHSKSSHSKRISLIQTLLAAVVLILDAALLAHHTPSHPVLITPAVHIAVHHLALLLPCFHCCEGSSSSRPCGSPCCLTQIQFRHNNRGSRLCRLR